MNTNITMKSIKIVIGTTVACLALLQSASALAYLAPEQVFGGAGISTATPPPTAREGNEVVERQQQNSALHRAAAQESLQSIEDEPADDYHAPAKVSPSRDLLDPSGDAAYELRQERRSNLKSAAPTIIITGEGAITDASGNVLHSGAPRISTTGPEHVALAVLGLAVVGFAFYLKRKSKSIESVLLR